MSRIYYQRRQRESLAMMAAAADPSCARMVHRRMASEYGKLVDADRRLRLDDADFPANATPAIAEIVIRSDGKHIPVRTLS